jgi:hypothetical protein
MKSWMLNSIVAVAIFVVLVIPIMIAAQTGQEQHNNQPVLKNLDTLEDTNTIAECIGDPGSGIADTRPDADTSHFYGTCGIDPSTNKLSGFCGAFTGINCVSRFDPQQCPVGANPISSCRQNNRCPPSLVDCGRHRCLVF